MSIRGKEIIIIRSLAESDLGIFAAHRPKLASKQRAININAAIARSLLSEELFSQGHAELKCTCVFDGTVMRQIRRLGKSGKNWRLGGKQIIGATFAKLDAKDFVLIRTVKSNDGSQPLTMTFTSRNTDHFAHAGLAAVLGKRMTGSMLVIAEDETGFDKLADRCPALPWTESLARCDITTARKPAAASLLSRAPKGTRGNR